jgi:spore germination protein KC
VSNIKRSNRFKAGLLCACLVLLTGCWDSLDIEQKDIHITEAIDFKDNEYYFYSEVANLTGQSQSGNQSDQNSKNKSVEIISAHGDSFVQARNNLERKSSKTVYLGASRLLIFTHRLADKSFEEYLNRSRLQNDTRKSLKVVTTSTEPETLLESTPDNSFSVGFAIDAILDELIKDGTAVSVDIGNVLEVLAVKKAGFLIPEVNLEEGQATVTGYAVFKDAKILGVIPVKESRGILWFLNPKASSVCEVSVDGEKYILDVYLKHKKIQPIYEDDKLTMQISMEFTAEVSYSDKAFLLSAEQAQSIQAALEEQTKRDILQTLAASQKEYENDYLGIYRYFRTKYNSAFQTMDWQKIYAQADVTAETKVNIVSSKLPQK